MVGTTHAAALTVMNSKPSRLVTSWNARETDVRFHSVGHIKVLEKMVVAVHQPTRRFVIFIAAYNSHNETSRYVNFAYNDKLTIAKFGS